MDRQEFADALHQRLLDAGFSDEYASQQSSVLLNRLLELPDSKAETYTTERNLDILVKKLVSQDGHLRVASNHAQPAREDLSPQVSESASNEEDAQSDVSESVPSKPNSAHYSRMNMPSVSDSDVEIINSLPGKRAAKAKHAADNPSDQYITCDHPKLLTALLGILCAPTILLMLCVSFGVFVAAFIALAASILLIALGIIAIVGGGSVISLASLLYGATQVLSPPRYIGLHEIGFGLLVAGVTMAASILLYNVAVRLIPFLFQKIAQLSKIFIKQLVGIAKRAVKGCEQL